MNNENKRNLGMTAEPARKEPRELTYAELEKIAGGLVVIGSDDPTLTVRPRRLPKLEL